MLNQIIEKANEMSRNENIVFRAALIEVCTQLPLEQYEELFQETGGTNLKRHMKMVERVRSNEDPRSFSVNTLRDMAVSSVLAVIVQKERNSNAG